MNVIFEEYPQLFPLFFVGLWSIVCFILSKFGGWSYLAKQYPCRESFKGEKSYLRSMKMGLVNYSNCVTVGVNSSELYLGIMFLFRIGHEPIKVPLVEVTGKKIEGTIFDHVVLSIKNVDIKIPKKLADKIVAASNGTWHYGDL
ncbi:hypothetical protein [Colwellia sp. Arc7-D]|uniref:hypothetical protein n=1 Tax=Colwellia sp. Arc7-D TaxID=2161872 RepID=UPI000D3A0410|nr:hypothetical protein [Colwellia sp. Arc7-D]AWB58279.1 hypothetical protein DBO93_12350 [Colwellia sp. Arc7-D]